LKVVCLQFEVRQRLLYAESCIPVVCNMQTENHRKVGPKKQKHFQSFTMKLKERKTGPKKQKHFQSFKMKLRERKTGRSERQTKTAHIFSLCSSSIDSVKSGFSSMLFSLRKCLLKRGHYVLHYSLHCSILNGCPEWFLYYWIPN
jgi:hypothetical protein